MINESKAHWYIFGAGIAFGFLLSVYLITGINISPLDLLVMVGKQIITALKAINPNFNTQSFLFDMELISIVGTLIAVISVLGLLRITGKLGITLLILGFSSMMLIFLTKNTITIFIGVILLILGNGICFNHDGQEPKDYVNSWF